MAGRSAIVAAGLACAAILTGCDSEGDVILGRGRAIAPLSAAEQARAYRAAMRATFDLTDPTLVLLLHPRMLPRYRSDTAGATVPAPLESALRSVRLIGDTCLPVEVVGRKTPRCPSAGSPGYVVRFSDIFVFPQDTLLLYADIQLYDTKDSPSTEVIHFENAYKVVPQDGEWRAVKEGRVPRD